MLHAFALDKVPNIEWPDDGTKMGTASSAHSSRKLLCSCLYPFIACMHHNLVQCMHALQSGLLYATVSGLPLRVSGLDEEGFGALHNTIRRGDLVGVKGLPGKSKRGELSVFPQSFIVLAPCLHMLPKYKLENQVKTLAASLCPCSCSASYICWPLHTFSRIGSTQLTC